MPGQDRRDNAGLLTCTNLLKLLVKALFPDREVPSLGCPSAAWEELRTGILYRQHAAVQPWHWNITEVSVNTWFSVTWSKVDPHYYSTSVPQWLWNMTCYSKHLVLSTKGDGVELSVRTSTNFALGLRPKNCQNPKTVCPFLQNIFFFFFVYRS